MNEERIKGYRAFRVGILTILMIISIILSYILRDSKLFGTGIGANLGFGCIFKQITGYDCPACGSTRMVVSILHGQFHQAFRYNPMMFISIPFLVYLYISCGKAYIKTGHLTERLRQMILAFGIIFIIYGILRNIPIFSYLAPTVIKF